MSFRDVLSDQDKRAFAKGGYGQRVGYGKRPALVVVDMTYSFVDPKYAEASGDSGWKAVEALKPLIAVSRRKGVPIIYTIAVSGQEGLKFGISLKKPLAPQMPQSRENDLIDEIAPASPEEVVIAKSKASAFFNTDLISVLTYHKIDTIIVAGATTSGCVRATVVDGASYGFHVIVPEEAVADRAALSHQVNLLDMDMKYADVEPLQNVLHYLEAFSD